LRLAHRKFCLVRLICPACGAAAEELQILPHAISCLRCGTHFAQATRALNLISGPLALAANIVETDLVSANPYTLEALSLIERVTGKGGMVLDCGAGARPKRTSNVINLEIVDYASSDVLAVGESLPFADGSFDAVMSLAVLEHVRDPFRCARELTRVLKPGGEILADVPFLQPVHGYPHHYYNMTAQGLRNLFAAGTTEIGHAVPNHGHPIFAVQWILREYRAGLPSGRAEEFAAMQVASLIDLDIPRFLGDPKARELAIQSRETIACLNSLNLRKN
jgi:SAM-dependent methyltransferase